METETLDTSIRKKKPISPREKLIWSANSTVTLFGAFWLVCVIQDFLVWLIARFLGLPLRLQFDSLVLTENASYTKGQVITTTFFVPIFFLGIGFLSIYLHNRYRLKKDLRKLFFLWMQYICFAIFGGAFITSFADEAGAIRVLWDYIGFNVHYLPIISFAFAALLIFFGIFSLWKFINISPSSEINKDRKKRLLFIFFVQVLPLLIFFGLGAVLYPQMRVSSRYFSVLMIWVPVLGGVITSFAKNSQLGKVPAFKDSDVKRFQPLYLGFAALIYVAVLFLTGPING